MTATAASNRRPDPQNKTRSKRRDFRERYARPIRERLGLPPTSPRPAPENEIVVAMIDSGFSSHPDFAERVVVHHDVVKGKTAVGPPKLPRRGPTLDGSWHGTMTTGVLAGQPAPGVPFIGVAPHVRLVLVRVGRGTRIRHADIAKGILWVVKTRRRFNTRIVNLSCGGDFERTCHRDAIGRACEAAARAGLLVVAAVGNSGGGAPVLQPAASPFVVAVGGFDDQGTGRPTRAYHSTFGWTVDGHAKPDVVAPAQWVPAPMVPGTAAFTRSVRLVELWQMTTAQRIARLATGESEPDLQLALREGGARKLQRALSEALRSLKVVAPGYQHVDGTSFAAPIVSGLAALALERDPSLSLGCLRQRLLSTATPIESSWASPIWQGHGQINAAAAGLESIPA